MNELIIEAKSDNLHDVFDFITSKMKELGCEKKIIQQCKLCAEEVFLNISSYAYNPTTGNVKVSVQVSEESGSPKLVFCFSDAGRPFDPLSHEMPDVDAPLEEREIGGLGIFLVTATMDDVYYEYKDGHNRLTFEKSL